MTASPVMEPVVRTLRRIYCGTAGVEYMHILDPAERSWIQAQMEGSQSRFILKPEVKRLDAMREWQRQMTDELKAIRVALNR